MLYFSVAASHSRHWRATSLHMKASHACSAGENDAKQAHQNSWLIMCMLQKRPQLHMSRVVANGWH
jgi:hypothetical protein